MSSWRLELFISEKEINNLYFLNDNFIILFSSKRLPLKKKHREVRKNVPSRGKSIYKLKS